jgi:hypothetical protein
MRTPSHPCVIRGVTVAGASGTDFLVWLDLSVEQANKAAGEHEALKLEIRGLREKLEDRFLLRAVQVLLTVQPASLPGLLHYQGTDLTMRCRRKCLQGLPSSLKGMVPAFLTYTTLAKVDHVWEGRGDPVCSKSRCK